MNQDNPNQPDRTSAATDEAPQTPPARGADASGHMQEADDAMRAAMSAPEPEAKPKQQAPAPAAGAPRKPAIRGPRVVEGGREHRTGRVVSVGPEDIFIEFGPKELGVAARKQWPDDELPKVGDDLEVVVQRFDAAQQLSICVRPGAVQKAEWELLEHGQIVEAMVTGANKGGLELEVAHHRAFMPASKVEIGHVADLKPYIGQKLTCKITKVDRAGRGNIVLSRRDILVVERREARAKLQETLKAGQTVEGTVRKIMEFGAFVDIGGVDGLVHISDLSYNRIEKVEDAVKEGDTVTVKILKIDWEKDRISLGLKQAQADPFKAAGESVKAGETVSGRVTKILEFGAFVEVAPGVEGLVHISELSWQRVPQVDSVVKVDDVVQVKVLEVDAGKRRVSLSIKQTTEAPRAPRGRGKGKGDEDSRTEEEIRQETPALRRMREQAKKTDKRKGAGGLGDHGSLGGMGLGDLAKLLGDQKD